MTRTKTVENQAPDVANQAGAHPSDQISTGAVSNVIAVAEGSSDAIKDIARLLKTLVDAKLQKKAEPGIKDLLSDIASKQSDMANANLVATITKSVSEQLSGELKDAKIQQQCLELRLLHVETHNKAISEENAALKDQVNLLAERSSSIEMTCEALHGKVNGLEASDKVALAVAEAREAQHDAMKSQLEATEATITDLLSAKDTIRAELRATKLDEQAKSDAILDLRSTHATLEQQQEVLQKTINQLKTESGNQNDTAQLSAKVAALENELKARDEMASVQRQRFNSHRTSLRVPRDQAAEIERRIQLSATRPARAQADVRQPQSEQLLARR